MSIYLSIFIDFFFISIYNMHILHNYLLTYFYFYTIISYVIYYILILHGFIQFIYGSFHVTIFIFIILGGIL